MCFQELSRILKTLLTKQETLVKTKLSLKNSKLRNSKNEIRNSLLDLVKTFSQSHLTQSSRQDKSATKILVDLKKLSTNFFCKLYKYVLRKTSSKPQCCNAWVFQDWDSALWAVWAVRAALKMSSISLQYPISFSYLHGKNKLEFQYIPCKVHTRKLTNMKVPKKNSTKYFFS